MAAIVEARMSSSRLAGKVLMSIGSKNSLEHIYGRLNKVLEIANTIVSK